MGRIDSILLGVGILITAVALLIRSDTFTVPELPRVNVPDLSLLWNVKRTPKEKPEPVAQVSPTPTKAPSIYPDRLIIPKLGIDSAVEAVGRTETGQMDVPKNAADVAWFAEGPTPSVRGNAVITGHYDTPSGRPAVFYRLNSLKVGDSIIVVLRNGTRHEFVVTRKDTIPYDTFPSDYVFATKYGINLNLITCNGIWDKSKKIYNQRLVVYATLKGTQFSAF